MEGDAGWIVQSFIFMILLGTGRGETVVTNTTLGQVMGLRLSLPGLSFPVISRYAGIPYAEPPIKELRFAKPVPKAPWDGVLNATAYGPRCPQTQSSHLETLPQLEQYLPKTGTDEDCLTLNVYVPHDIVAASGPLPVMVWIYGGSWTTGEGAIYDGTFLTSLGRVILVNLNYRLGMFGFLSTGDDSALGNYGLWDQRLAIQWVKDNIGTFGGDPDQITIFGESAGGWSVTMQMISPLNDKTLFQRVISQSGATDPGLILSNEQAKYQVLGVASAIGCNIHARTTSRDIMSCLRDASYEALLDVNKGFTPRATVDGEFLTQDLESLLSHPRVGQYDLLIGFNSHEGASFTSIDSLTAEQLRETVQGLVALTCRCENPKEISNAVLAYYFGADKLDNPSDNVLKYIDLLSEIYFQIPAAHLINQHVMQSHDTATYMYYFTYETGNEFFIPPSYQNLISGAPHGLEVFYVFGLSNILFSGNAEAFAVFSAMTSYWTEFARNGRPSGVGIPDWPEFDAENETYIVLDANITTAQRFKADKLSFWNNYVPTIIERAFEPTCSYKVPTRGSSTQKPGNRIVQISSKDGEVLGTAVGVLRVADEAMGGEEVAQFLGIPYAKPPLGRLRFRPPQETGQWGDEPRGFLDRLPPACPQDVTEDPWMVRLGLNYTSEDCLTLNIFAPQTSINGSPLPVLLFIHVGYGVSSTSSVYDAVQLASQTKSVVVVINHRLGALGFLSTEDDVAPGNYGLGDILASLKWVKRYIGSFGGNGERVTVAGHGSGAVLAHMLILSEKAQGLFQRAILMSASAISPPVDNQVHPAASLRAKALAIALGCPTTSSELMINCLREKPVENIVQNTRTPPFGLAFPTVTDGEIMLDDPINVLKAGRINDVEIIFGVAQDEDAGPAVTLLGLDCPTADVVEQRIQLVSSLSFNNPTLASQALVAEYADRGGLGDACETRAGFRQLMNDYLSYWSTLEAARIHADAGQSVYFYSFDHKTLSHYVGPLPPWAGPALSDDLQFLFGDPYSPLVDELQLPYRIQDKQMTMEMMEMFKNFIHTGNPGRSLSGNQWPRFNSTDLAYMSLTDCPQAYSGHINNWERTHLFWADLMATITTATPAATATPTPAATAPPVGGTTCPTDQETCIVGEGIGLMLTPSQASTVIEALIGTTIGALVLAVFLLGACIAYRVRAKRLEASEGQQNGGRGLPSYLDTPRREELDTKL